MGIECDRALSRLFPIKSSSQLHWTCSCLWNFNCKIQVETEKVCPLNGVDRDRPKRVKCCCIGACIVEKLDTRMLVGG
jgi:hypothetical protein